VSIEQIDLHFQREPWIAEAACAGLSGPVASDLFFPSRGEPTAGARVVCGGCPVREECLDYALRNGIQYGIWGGTSERERRSMRRERRVAIGARPTGPLPAA